MFGFACIVLLLGYPVAFTLAGSAILFAFIGDYFGVFPMQFLKAIPQRIFGTMTNEILMAVPLFIFMGTILEKSGIAEKLLETMAILFGKIRGGLAYSVIIVGGMLAASTGIVGSLYGLNVIVNAYVPSTRVGVFDLSTKPMVYVERRPLTVEEANPGFGIVGSYMSMRYGLKIIRPEVGAIIINGASG